MTAETEYLIGEIHHLVLLRVHPLVIADQLGRKPASLYKLLLTHGDPAAEHFSEYRSNPSRSYTREQLDRRAWQARERLAARKRAGA